MTAGGTTVTDSAGIEIVTNARDVVSLEDYEVSGIPKLQIPGGDYTGPAFYRITDVALLPDGSLAVAAEGSHRVILFGPTGMFVRAFGREGNGPGEFEALGAVVPIPPDSLVTFDYQLGRLTFFGPDGEVGRTEDVSEFIPRSGFAHLLAAPNGFFLVREAGLDALGETQTARGEARSLRLDMLGDSVASYGPFPGMDVFRNDVMMGNLPFGSRLFAAVRGQRLVVGTGDAPEVREFLPDGSTARIIRWADHERAVTDERMNDYLDHLLALAPENQREQMRDLWLDVPYPPREPAYSDVIESSSGTLWVGDYPGPEALIPEARGPARSWHMFDDDGVLFGRATTPVGFRLMAVDDNQAIGVYQDEVGVESVRVYSIERQ